MFRTAALPVVVGILQQVDEMMILIMIELVVEIKDSNIIIL